MSDDDILRDPPIKRSILYSAPLWLHGILQSTIDCLLCFGIIIIMRVQAKNEKIFLNELRFNNIASWTWIVQTLLIFSANFGAESYPYD